MRNSAAHEYLPPSVLEIIATVSEKHADSLDQSLRYDRYRMHETPAEWIHLLGDDVLLGTHADVTAAIVVELLTHQENIGEPLEESDGLYLITAALNHDWGEIILKDQGVGDISYELKTMADEAIELSVFESICADLEQSPELDMIKEAYYTVAQSKEGLGELFNIVERVGYLRTALRAYNGINNRWIENWTGLVGNVFSNQIEKLVAYASTHPFVDYVLDTSQDEITDIFSIITQLRSIPTDRDGKPCYDNVKLQRAQEAWYQYLQNSTNPVFA